jgi:hypothetical protein
MMTAVKIRRWTRAFFKPGGSIRFTSNRPYRSEIRLATLLLALSQLRYSSIRKIDFPADTSSAAVHFRMRDSSGSQDPR